MFFRIFKENFIRMKGLALHLGVLFLPPPRNSKIKNILACLGEGGGGGNQKISENWSFKKMTIFIRNWSKFLIGQKKWLNFKKDIKKIE